MRTKDIVTPAVLILTIVLSGLAATDFAAPAASGARPHAVSVQALLIGRVPGQQFPALDKIANKVIAKYQGSSCEQLWQERNAKANQPRSAQEQEAVSILQSDPQRRAEFINRVAAPIANKMFECGLIP